MTLSSSVRLRQTGIGNKIIYIRNLRIRNYGIKFSKFTRVIDVITVNVERLRSVIVTVASHEISDH